jgi:hypothetical protein
MGSIIIFCELQSTSPGNEEGENESVLNENMAIYFKIIVRFYNSIKNMKFNLLMLYEAHSEILQLSLIRISGIFQFRI